MNFLLFEPLMSPGLMAMVLTLLKVTSVLVIALAVTLAMRRESAGSRHLVWLVAFVALLALPALATWAPIPIRVLPPVAPRTATPTREPVVSVPPVTLPAASQPAAHDAEQRVVTAGRTSSGSQAVALPKIRSIGFGLALVLLWSVVAVALLVRLVVGAWWIQRIVSRARVLDDAGWQRPLFELADRLGLAQAPDLLQSERVRIPFTSGLFGGRIVLPAESEGWSAERRMAVLMHELAHIRRRDLIGHTLSGIVCALYWFHPLVWTAAKRLRAESERACDDVALELGAPPSDYAEHLLDIVSQVRDHRTPAVALAMANPNEFEGRMLAILNPRIRRRGLSRIRAAWLVGSLATLALAVAAVSPAPRAAASASPAPATKKQTTQTSRTVQTAQSELTSQVNKTEARIDPFEREALAENVKPSSPKPQAKAGGTKSAAESEDEEADADRRVTILAKSLRTDTSPDVRRVAAWGLERFASASTATSALAAALAGDEHEDVREMAAWALSGGDGPAAAAALQKAFGDKSHGVRRTAAWAAGSVGDPSAVPGLTAMLSDSDPDLRDVAAWSIGSCEPDQAPEGLVRLLSDSNRDVRLSAVWALREIGDENTADELEAAFRREQDPEVQRGLIKALGAMGDRAVGTLTRLVDSHDPEIRAVAITALAGGDATGPWPWPRPEPRPFP